MFNNFSPNMLKTYQFCPKKFYYKYIEGINIPQSTLPFEKGKKIHALANYFLQGINISRIETALSDSEKEIWQELLNNEYFKKDTLKSEYQISCKVSDFWIGGRLDAVVHDYENYYILDYKTGSIPKNPQYDYQTMVYLLSLDRVLKSYETLSFVYIDLKHGKNCVIGFNEKLKTDYENQIEQICHEINTDTLYKKNCTNCERCEFNGYCR